MTTADGRQIVVHGSTELSVCFCGCTLPLRVTAVDMQPEAILGMDTLCRWKASVNISRGEIDVEDGTNMEGNRPAACLIIRFRPPLKDASYDGLRVSALEDSTLAGGEWVEGHVRGKVIGITGVCVASSGRPGRQRAPRQAAGAPAGSGRPGRQRAPRQAAGAPAGSGRPGRQRAPRQAAGAPAGSGRPGRQRAPRQAAGAPAGSGRPGRQRAPRQAAGAPAGSGRPGRQRAPRQAAGAPAGSGRPGRQRAPRQAAGAPAGSGRPGRQRGVM